MVQKSNSPVHILPYAGSEQMQQRTHSVSRKRSIHKVDQGDH